MSELNGLATDLSNEVYNDLKTSLGDQWGQLTDENKAIIKHVATNVLVYRFKVKMDPDDEELKEILETWESSVLDWNAWGQMAIGQFFWESVSKVANALGEFLGAAAGKALDELI